MRRKAGKELNAGGEEELVQLTVNAGRGSNVYELVMSQRQAVSLDGGSPRDDKWLKLAMLQLHTHSWLMCQELCIPVPSLAPALLPTSSLRQQLQGVQPAQNFSAFSVIAPSVTRSNWGTPAMAEQCGQAREGDSINFNQHRLQP